jgi:hypothetical protein
MLEEQFHIVNRFEQGIDTLKIIDNNGCKISKSFQIYAIGEMSVSGNVISNETRFLSRTGSANITVTGGTAPFIYSWYPQGGNNDTAFNLVADLYTVTVIDSNGCMQKTLIKVESPDPLRAYISIIQPSTDSSLDGTASAIVLGGTPPYVYTWTSGHTSEEVTNFGLENDTLTVTDANGCISTNIAV